MKGAKGLKFFACSLSVCYTGSMVPFYEAVSLAYGAAFVVTVEYNDLSYDHPKLHTIKPSQLPLSYGPGSFHAILSISSYEHDGLGRWVGRVIQIMVVD